jgi:hypothetical protein
VKLKRRPPATNPPEHLTLEERLAQVRYLALQRWAKHIAALAQTQERQARAIATQAVADIEARSGTFSPSDRKALIAALTTREFAHLVACVNVIYEGCRERGGYIAGTGRGTRDETGGPAWLILARK